jgi:hypothetical protein
MAARIDDVLECAAGAAVELDGERVQVSPGSAVLIPPGVRHRAVGPMRVLIVVVPKFDPADEWFDLGGTGTAGRKGSGEVEGSGRERYPAIAREGGAHASPGLSHSRSG